MNEDQEQIEIRLTQRRASLRAVRRAALVEQEPLAVATSASRVRKGSDFLNALRGELNPADVGLALATSFMHAVKSHNVALLRLLLPYVLGQPEEPDHGDGSALELLLSAMRQPALQAPQTIDIEPEQENPDADA